MKEHIRRFITYLKAEVNASEHTIRNYSSDLRQFERFLQSGDSNYFSRLTLRRFLVHLQKSGCAPRTIARKIASLRSFLEFLVEEGHLASNPARGMPVPRQEKKLPKFLDEREMVKLLEASDKKTVLGIRDRAILETLYSTGIRVGELVGMRQDSIDFIGGVVRVSGKGKKERIVPIGEKALKALSTYLKKREELLAKPRAGIAQDRNALFLNKWGGRLTVRSICRMVGKYS